MSEANNPQPSLAPEVSPLVEADPASINDLIQSRIDDIFNKPPLMLSDDDLRVAVDYYRKQRQRFLVESAEKANKPPKPRAKAGSKPPTSVADALASRMEDLL